MSPANLGFGLGLGLRLFLAFLQLGFIKAGLQHFHGAGAVLVLRALVLALDHDFGRQVGNPDRAVGGIDVLAAGPRCPVGIHPQVVFINFNFNFFVNHRVDPDAGKAGVAAGVGIKR